MALAMLLAAMLPVAVQSSVTTPIPASPPVVPPPIPDMPAAGADPPSAALIADPITPEATCGSWERTSTYGGQWPTDQVWWEFSCAQSWFNCVGACNADGTENNHWTIVDHFVAIGSQAVFYGERYEYYFYDSWAGEASGCDLWWDQGTTQWYVHPKIECPYSPAGINYPPQAWPDVECVGLACDFYGSGSDPDGSITAYAWSHGDGTSSTAAVHSYRYADRGTYTVRLTVTDDDGASGSHDLVLWLENRAPVAAIALDCAGLTCRYDGRASHDTDGTVVAYRWDFGDGATSSASTGSHTFAALGRYALTLRVEDDAGTAVTATNDVTLIGLDAEVGKVRGVPQVTLAWSGASSAGFTVSRDGVIVNTTTGSTYTDVFARRRTGPVTYVVCEVGRPVCSAPVTVSL